MNPGSDKLGFASTTRMDNILVDTAVARLEGVIIGRTTSPETVAFQFQTGAIRRIKEKGTQGLLNCFNSKLVRLKVIC